jgi:hypothetical protein
MYVFVFRFCGQMIWATAEAGVGVLVGEKLLVGVILGDFVPVRVGVGEPVAERVAVDERVGDGGGG